MGGAEKKEEPPAVPKMIRNSCLAAIAEDDDLAATITPESLKTRRPETTDAIFTVAAHNRSLVDKAIQRITMAQRVALCFLVDTTGSMESYITAVKEQILSIVSQAAEAGCEIVGTAFVGYKDWSEGVDHFEILDFSVGENGGSSGLDSFRRHVHSVKAGGGGDGPEDVLGGLQHCVNLTWPRSSGARLIIHVADAPPHGKRFTLMHDNYPDGHPSDPDPEGLFRMLKQLGVEYHFSKLNDSCDQMLIEFGKFCGKPIESFSLTETSKLSHSVTSSIMRTVSRTTSAASVASAGSRRKERPFELHSCRPDFSTIPEVKVWMLKYELPSLETILNFKKDFEETKYRAYLKIAPHPFAKGSLRLAYYGEEHFLEAKEPKKPKSVILKEFINLPTNPKVDKSRYLVDLEVQSVAAKLAFEFNGRGGRLHPMIPLKIKFLLAKVISYKEPSSGLLRLMAVEPQFITN